MSQITTKHFIHGLCLIHSEKPTYKVGHDGSTGSCDGIGFIRGGLLRGGATKIKGMKDPNQFARKYSLRKNNGWVKLGDVLLKVRDIDDTSMPLPFNYRFGGSDCNGDTTNYADVGVVVCDSPIAIMQMTNEGMVKSDDISEWDYVCSLPYLEENKVSSAIIYSDSPTIKMYERPLFSCKEFIEVPNGTMVLVKDKRSVWANINYGNQNGFVLTKHIKDMEESNMYGLTDAERKTLEDAYMIIGKIIGMK